MNPSILQFTVAIMLESNFPFFSSNFSLGPPETQQQQQQLHQSKEQLNSVVPNTASNTINSTTATTITGSSSNLNNNTTSEMVSRRKILSRSRDDLNLVDQVFVQDDEDTWYNKDKLFRVSLNFPAIFYRFKIH